MIDDKELLDAIAKIVAGIVSNNSVTVHFKDDGRAGINVLFSAKGMEGSTNIATIASAVKKGLQNIE